MSMFMYNIKHKNLNEPVKDMFEISNYEFCWRLPPFLFAQEIPKSLAISFKIALK